MSGSTDEKEKQIAQLSSLIGNTPLLEIDFTFRGERRAVYAKAENMNMTGSIKDRMAFYILKKAYERGALAPGGLIIEATSGNIQGISDEFIPPIVKLNELDDVIAVDDGDSIIMAQKLAAQLGIAVGISSGANFIGALMVQNTLGPDSVVVTVFSDDNKKYLSTDLMKAEPVKPGFLAPDIDLLAFRGFKRTCETSCVPSECEPDVRPVDRMELPACPRRSPAC